MNSSKRLILNADDFGCCPDVNDAIEQAAETGVLGGVSVLANGECWQEALGFLRDSPELSAGVHLNFVEGSPVSSATEVKVLTGPDGRFLGLGRLLRRWILRPLAFSRAVEIEGRAQIERIVKAGVSLSHLDSHQHFHAFPPAYRAAIRLCKEYGIRAIRHPRETNNGPRSTSNLLLRTSLAVARVSRDNGLFHNDYFLGFKRAGAYGTTELIEDLRQVPVGLTEVALHPSIEDGIPYSSLAGARELAALMDDSLQDSIRRLGVELTTWTAVAQ